MLLKHQKGILNRWREYFCDLLNPVTVQHLEASEEQIGEKIHVAEAEVSTAIKSLKAGKAPGEEDIWPEMLKVINNFAVCLFQIAWKTGEVPQQWQTSVLIPIYKKEAKKKCINYRSISLKLTIAKSRK